MRVFIAHEDIKTRHIEVLLCVIQYLDSVVVRALFANLTTLLA